MGTRRFTRRRFLKALAAGAAYLALAAARGCGSLELTRRIGSLQVPRLGPLGAQKVWPLPSVKPKTPKSVWEFRSRPDLRPGAVEMIAPVQETSSGYILIALKEGAGEHGPMIVDELGQLVWLGNHRSARDFKVQRYRGKPVLTWWEGNVVAGHGEGEYVIFDDSYREIARVRAGNGYRGDLHEFLITPDDTALLTAYAPARTDLSPSGGPKDGAVWEGIVQEVDIETRRVLFEWHSLQHVSPEESYYAPTKGAGWPHDYFHINSIDVDHDGNLLVSARNTCAVYKVDSKSGEVLWRLGGKKSDFEMGEGTRTAFQHDARRHQDGTITIFDNGAHPKVHQKSRAIVVELDEEGMRARMARAYTLRQEILSTSQGNAQHLPDRNVFVGWGSEPFISEFSYDGEVLLYGRLPDDGESYRAFRFPWKGDPTDAPAVAVERRPEGKVAVYASWNGATRIASWEVVSGKGPGQKSPVGSVPRDGFETAMLAQTTGPYVAVRALDSSGEILGTSDLVEL